MTSDWDQSSDEIRQQVREGIAVRLFNLLPVPAIAKVCDMTVVKVLTLVRQSESEGTVATEQEGRVKSPRVTLLGKPLCNTEVPMAHITKSTIRRHKEVLAKLQRHAKG
ncbi:hypothetical protein NZD89_02115 [Alicyclobacillus fastidiosus]|uniref:Uncharacterized protein n=1 Tax=Alicyclobacillus fastidiosus TaxID=392011 RepID=A0ABY6ZHJ6_9BACL|nr:hypothetical protein [Alicyclobacillus fastidiosus]WAH42324.1 hypothetical protein NZD89_02115 [Alicyclobacillus fastidiosus]GMA64132.1 hypothetical protein GCM10025859_45720 [Alicyclobacillus fastidiosus]